MAYGTQVVRLQSSGAVDATLQQGLATPEHAAFVARLIAAAGPSE